MKFLFDAVSSAVSCLSAFKDVFSKKLLSRGLRCGPGTEANGLVLVLMKSSPCSLGLVLRERVLKGWEAATVHVSSSF